MAGVGSSAATSRLAIVPEVTWGTTPATPAFATLRMTSESLSPNKATVRSNELRPDRNVSDEILTALTAGGSIETEMSYGTYDALLESLLQNTWATNALVNGITEKFFTFEKTNDIPGGSTKLYQRLRGGLVNTLSMSVPSSGLVTASWGIMAKDYTTATSIVTGATYAAAGVSPVLSSGAHVGSLTSAAISGGITVESLSIDITNNLRERMAVGTLGLAGIGSGRFEVTGSLNAYFSSQALLDAFIAHSDADLSFTLGAAAGSRYRVSIPRLKFTTGSLVAGGNDSDLMLNMNFTGVFDTTTSGTIRIERAV